MNKQFTRTHLAYALVIGSFWGFGEVALGAGLKSCAHLMSGSLMTGVALFFIAAAWVASGNILTPVLTVLIASVFKLFDAVLLSLPVMHGAIGNPIFAFLLEGMAFIVLIAIFRNVSWKSMRSRAMLGGGSALIAVAMFPLVKYATGVPACVYPNTMVPLSVFFAPLAIAFSALTVPLGFTAGVRLSAWLDSMGLRVRNGFLRHALSPMTLTVALALVLLFRLIVS